MSQQNLAGKPVQRWLIRDRQVRGSVLSATSEGGPRMGLAVPDSDNLGGLAPVLLGDPDDATDASLILGLTQGGSLGVGRWVWQDAGGTWRGAHSDLYLWGHHAPQDTSHQGACVVYSSVYRRVLVISVDQSSTAVVRISRSVLNARPMSSGDWASVTLTPHTAVSTSGHALAACELRDGTLLLAVRRASTARRPGDFDLYRSVDGGASWTLAVEAILSQTDTTPTSIDVDTTPRMAASGDWVRLLCTASSGLAIVSLVSSDGGMSWASLTQLTTSSDLDGSLIAVQASDYQPFSIVAVDDATGAFALFANPLASGDTHKLGMWYATRDDDWSSQTSIFSDMEAGPPTIDTTPRSYVAWADPFYLWAWVYAGDPGDADRGWEAFRVPRDRVLDGTSWEGIAWADPLKMRGASRLSPIKMTAAWCEDRAVLCGYLQDQEEGGQVTQKASRPWVAWVGGWSARPWWQDYLGAEAAESVHWTAAQGEPAGGATSSPLTSWTDTLTGAGTHSWSAKMYVQCEATASSGAVAKFDLYTTTGASVLPPQWDNGVSVWASEWTVAVGNTSPASAGTTSNAIRWQTPSVGGGGFGWTITCQLGTNQAVLYNGSSPIATLSNLGLNTAESDQYHRMRFVVAPATSPSSPVGILQHRRDDGDEWVETATFNIGIATSVGVTRHHLEFGLLGAPLVLSAILSRWRDVRQNYLLTEPDYTAFSVTDLPGAVTSPRRRGLTAGSTATTNPSRIAVAWGGAGGARNDRWTHALDHAYPATALMVDSPRVAWRSAAGATSGQRIVLDACGADASADDGSRWTHSAMVLLGCEHGRTIVTYADDADGTVNAVVAATVAPTQYSGVRVAGAAGRWVSLTRPTAGWRDGDLNGRFLQVTAGVLSTNTGRVYRVSRHVYDGTVHRVELDADGQFGFTGISAGDSVSIFSDRAWASYGQTVVRRYLILQFGVVGDNTWGDAWTCGSIVPGVERAWDPPLLWSHTDEHQPHVTVQRALSGQSWAYQDAPPERLWTGRQQGANQGERQALRDAMQYLARYGEEPCALLLNLEHLEDQDRSVLLTRYEGALDLDNQAYARAGGTSSQAWAVGDLAVSFREVT